MLGFRVWHKWDGRFITDRDYLINQEGNLVEFDGSNFLTSYDQEDELIPMQSTGLNDMNGQTIYEGDVLCISYVKTHDSVVYEKIILVEDVKSFWIDFDRKIARIGYFYKIVGNKFESPELLEKIK